MESSLEGPDETPIRTVPRAWRQFEANFPLQVTSWETSEVEKTDDSTETRNLRLFRRLHRRRLLSKVACFITILRVLSFIVLRKELL